MTNYIRGGEWNRKEFCPRCGYSVEKKNFSKKAGLCKTCISSGSDDTTKPQVQESTDGKER